MNQHVRPETSHLRTMIDTMTLEQLVGSVRSPGYPSRIGNYQYTHSGRLFFSCDPRPAEVFIDDIAIQLSRIPRFNGASEAYIGDLIRPVKRLPIIGDIYLKIEAGIEGAIADRFKLVYPWPDSVKWADEAVVGAEVAQNIKSGTDNHLIDDRAAAASAENLQLHYWSPELAHLFFMQRFIELATARGVQ